MKKTKSWGGDDNKPETKLPEIFLIVPDGLSAQSAYERGYTLGLNLRAVETSGVKEGTTYEIINNSDKPMIITLPQRSNREAELEKCLGELVSAYESVFPNALIVTKAKSLLNPDKTDL